MPTPRTLENISALADVMVVDVSRETLRDMYRLHLLEEYEESDHLFQTDWTEYMRDLKGGTSCDK